jgi:hypothetical protein
MSKFRNYSNDEDLKVSNFEVETTETELLHTDSGYIAVRRISYEKVTPAIKVSVGEDVPMEIINDNPVFVNLLSKGAIVKKED